MPGTGTNEPISVFILDSPGLMRDSLRALFSAVPGVQVLGMSNLSEVTLDHLLGQRPDCIVVESPESSPHADTLKLLNRLKQNHPQARCLVISPSPNQNHLYLAAGANFVLMKGFALRELKVAFDVLFNISANHA